MDDLISRAAACDEIGKMIHEYREKGDHDLADALILTRRYVLKRLPAVDAVPVVQQWISIKDRLPEAAGWYLVFYNGSAMQVAFFKGKKWPFDNHYHTITHWMPLPEPPKMDGDT